MATVTIDPDSGIVLVDSTLALSVSLADSAGTPLTGRAVTWSSSDPSLVTVSSAGVVSAAGYGDAAVVATSEGRSDTATVRARLRFVQLAADGFHSCGLTAAGRAWCWGDNTHGELGTGLPGGAAAAPARVAGDLQLTGITAGVDYTCGLDRDGAAWCWGDDARGQLGDGTAAGIQRAPVKVTGGLTFTTISAGGRHTCGLSGGRAYCWGDNSFGQIYWSPSGAVARPSALLQPGGASVPMAFESISVGYWHACATAFISDGGGLWCWGGNSQHEISTVDASPVFGRSFPVTSSVYSAGFQITCAIGVNDEDQVTRVSQCIGLDITDERQNPHEYPQLATAVEIDAGTRLACALLPGGALLCWGQNNAGQVGIGAAGAAISAPVEVSGNRTYQSVSVGAIHACAIASDGVSFCWGANDSGAVGDGTTEPRTAPTPVSGQL